MLEIMYNSKELAGSIGEQPWSPLSRHNYHLQSLSGYVKNNWLPWWAIANPWVVVHRIARNGITPGGGQLINFQASCASRRGVVLSKSVLWRLNALRSTSLDLIKWVCVPLDLKTRSHRSIASLTEYPALTSSTSHPHLISHTSLSMSPNIHYEWTLGSHSASVNALAISPDSTMLLSGGKSLPSPYPYIRPIVFRGRCISLPVATEYWWTTSRHSVQVFRTYYRRLLGWVWRDRPKPCIHIRLRGWVHHSVS